MCVFKKKKKQDPVGPVGTKVPIPKIHMPWHQPTRCVEKHVEKAKRLVDHSVDSKVILPFGKLT